MMIGRAITKESRDFGPRILHDRRHPKSLQRIGRSAFFVILSINRCSSLCKLKFQLNCEQIKQFWSKFLSFFVIPLHYRLNSDHIEARLVTIIARIDWNRPLNIERTSKKKSKKYSSINAN